jgi:hypothetical protein
MDEPGTGSGTLLIFDALCRAGARRVRRGRFVFLRLRKPARRLDPGLQRDLLAQFSQVTDAIYRSDTAHYWKQRSDYFETVDELWTLHLDGAFVGWTGVRWMRRGRRRVLYVDTLNVRPRALRSGVGGYTLGAMLVHEYIFMCFRRPLSPAPCAFRTQNPVVYRLAQAASRRSVFPGIGAPGARDAAESLRVAGFVARELSPGKPFADECSVIRGCYGKSLYGGKNLARIAEPEVASYWREHLDVDGGDAMVIVVRPTRLEAASALARYWLAMARGARRAVPGGRRAASPGGTPGSVMQTGTHG